MARLAPRSSLKAGRLLARLISQMMAWASVACLLINLSGCASGDELSASARERLSEYRGADPFPSEHALDEAFLDGRLRLSGYTATRLGERLELELVHDVTEAPTGGLRRLATITRLVDEEGNLIDDASRQGLVRELYPPSAWERGEWIRERLSFALPSDRSGPLFIEHGYRYERSGLFTGALAALLARLGREAPERIARFKIELSDDAPKRRAQPRPRLQIKRASGPLTIDGELSEEDWQRAPVFSDFRQTMTGLETRASGRLRLLYDEDALYLAAEIDDHDLRSDFRERDDPLWEADVFEIFLMPSRGAPDYLEIQISPRGVIFDSHFERRRQPAPHGHVDFDSELELSVVARGTFSDRRADQGYLIEARLPFSAIEARLSSFERPKSGDSLRANFFILDRGRGYHSAAAASPPLFPDFHYTPAFARLVFID